MWLGTFSNRSESAKPNRVLALVQTLAGLLFGGIAGWLLGVAVEWPEAPMVLAAAGCTRAALVSAPAKQPVVSARRKLGGLEVSALGLGCMRMSFGDTPTDKQVWVLSNQDEAAKMAGKEVVVKGKADAATKTIEVASMELAPSK